MKPKRTALPVRPVVDTQAACRLLAKQFAARRAMWEKYIGAVELSPPASHQLAAARARQSDTL